MDRGFSFDRSNRAEWIDAGRGGVDLGAARHAPAVPATGIALKILLDFDGVLFNSAFEAFSVCNRCTDGLPAYRNDVGFEEFLAFRAVVTDAWQYNRLYQRDRQLSDIRQLPGVAADDQDWAFSKAFFTARAAMMLDPDWAKMMAPYDFFFQLRPWLKAHRDRFAILSTRNVASIRATLAYFDADGLDVFGQEDIRRHGSKLAVATAQGWLDRGRMMVVYVDDMNAHLEPFEGKVHLPLQANWGYDSASPCSLSQHQVLTVIASLLKLADPAG